MGGEQPSTAAPTTWKTWPSLVPGCNWHKGTNLSGIDPDTGKVTRLFHPRHDECKQHFAHDGARIVGQTAEGRTTVWLLEVNTGDRFIWRESLMRLGLWE